MIYDNYALLGKGAWPSCSHSGARRGQKTGLHIYDLGVKVQMLSTPLKKGTWGFALHGTSIHLFWQEPPFKRPPIGGNCFVLPTPFVINPKLQSLRDWNRPTEFGCVDFFGACFCFWFPFKTLTKRVPMCRSSGELVKPRSDLRLPGDSKASKVSTCKWALTPTAPGQIPSRGKLGLCQTKWVLLKPKT